MKGEQTLGEDLADNGGLRQSLQVWHLKALSNAKLSQRKSQYNLP